ncbi:MAG: hypothetical protein MUO54_17445, partial [Anaerolineales bacterium]|nr:hypothetical protein [Anaerolineales bacterium]
LVLFIQNVKLNYDAIGAIVQSALNVPNIRPLGIAVQNASDLSRRYSLPPSGLTILSPSLFRE